VRYWAQLTFQLGVWFTLAGIFQPRAFSGQWWSFIAASMLLGMAFVSAINILSTKGGQK